MYHSQDSNIRKTWLLMAAFFVVLIANGWAFSYMYQSPQILYVFVAISILMNVFGYWYSDKIVLKMYRAEPVTDGSHPDLYNIVENLSITAGLPMPKVYIIPDAQPNAFATGRNKEHAAIAVTSGLLQVLNKTELEGVIAHELAHVGNRDTLLATIVVVLVGFISLISDFFLRSRMIGSGDNRNGNAHAIFFVVGIVLSILSPLVAVLIQLAISRKREFLADASGALLTRYPEGLASALEKIASHGHDPMKRANSATAHLFISSPFGATGRAVDKLFMTHPPIEERVKILRGMNP